MSFSELQYKYESAFGPLDEPICTLENIRRLGTVENSILTHFFNHLISEKRSKFSQNDVLLSGQRLKLYQNRGSLSAILIDN